MTADTLTTVTLTCSDVNAYAFLQGVLLGIGAMVVVALVVGAYCSDSKTASKKAAD